VFYADLRQLGDAINAYRQALKIYPDNDILHYLLGDAYFKAFNARNARIEMETAVELIPIIMRRGVCSPGCTWFTV
jgi:tetratricopeptide (TPR) repeat protein